MAQSKRGRPKGSTNKITNLAKWAIQMAFDKLGGVERLVAWVREDKANEFAFYTKIYPKLMPRPAIDIVPEPVAAAARAAAKSVFTWKTPDWAKKFEKAQLRNGAAAVVPSSAAEAGVRSGEGAAPDEGEDD